MLQQFLFAEDGTDLDPSTWADGMYTVGRELEGNPHARSLQLRHEKVSRKHCVFALNANRQITVTDTGSSTGTFVNGERLDRDPRVLSKGDVVSLVHICRFPPTNLQPEMRERLVAAFVVVEPTRALVPQRPRCQAPGCCLDEDKKPYFAISAAVPYCSRCNAERLAQPSPTDDGASAAPPPQAPSPTDDGASAAPPSPPEAAAEAGVTSSELQELTEAPSPGSGSKRKLPPGWTRIMDYGKCNGYRSPSGHRVVKTKPAAWREHERMAQDDDADAADDGESDGEGEEPEAEAEADDDDAPPVVPGPALASHKIAEKMQRAAEGPPGFNGGKFLSEPRAGKGKRAAAAARPPPPQPRSGHTQPLGTTVVHQRVLLYHHDTTQQPHFFSGSVVEYDAAGGGYNIKYDLDGEQSAGVARRCRRRAAPTLRVAVHLGARRAADRPRRRRR